MEGSPGGGPPLLMTERSMDPLMTVRSMDASPVLNRTFGSLEELRELDRMHAARAESGAKLDEGLSCSAGSTRDDLRDDGGSTATPDGGGDLRLDAVRRSYEEQISSLYEQWQQDARRAPAAEPELRRRGSREVSFS